MICATTVVTPTITSALASAAIVGAAAAAASASDVIRSIRVMSRALFQDVAEGHQEGQARRVADLPRGDQQSRRGTRHAE